MENTHAEIIKSSNQIYLYSPFLHQLIFQSAVQKPSLKPQTASSAGVEARWLGENSLGRNLERNQAMRGGQSSSEQSEFPKHLK